VPSVFSSLKQRVCFSLHALQERVSLWLKPPTTSLVLGTFADLTRGKAELLAENALLRHQLITLHRQVKRPVYRKRDRLLLVFLTSMVRTWQQALSLIQPETQIEDAREKAKALVRDDCLDQADGGKQSALGSRAHSRRVPQVGYSGQQTDYPEVYAPGSPKTHPWTDLEDVLAQSCHRGVGL
jgi:hypothetical protein